MGRKPGNYSDVRRQKNAKVENKEPSSSRTKVRSAGCPVPDPVDCKYGVPVAEGETGRRFTCSNVGCVYAQNLVHDKCWESFEQRLLNQLSQGPGKKLTMQQLIDNLWAKKGQNRIAKYCKCICGGHIARDEKYDIEREKQEREAIEAQRGIKRKKTKKESQLPRLNPGDRPILRTPIQRIPENISDHDSIGAGRRNSVGDLSIKLNDILPPQYSHQYHYEPAPMPPKLEKSFAAAIHGKAKATGILEPLTSTLHTPSSLSESRSLNDSGDFITASPNPCYDVDDQDIDTISSQFITPCLILSDSSKVSETHTPEQRFISPLLQEKILSSHSEHSLFEQHSSTIPTSIDNKHCLQRSESYQQLHNTAVQFSVRPHSSYYGYEQFSGSRQSICEIEESAFNITINDPAALFKDFLLRQEENVKESSTSQIKRDEKRLAERLSNEAKNDDRWRRSGQRPHEMEPQMIKNHKTNSQWSTFTNDYTAMAEVLMADKYLPGRLRSASSWFSLGTLRSTPSSRVTLNGNIPVVSKVRHYAAWP